MPSTPTATPNAGSYNSAQSVELSSAGSDYIQYSTSATPASCSAGTRYESAISVASSRTIYVRACDNAGNSTTASFAYIIDTEAPSTPTASPDAGTYTAVQSVELSSTGSDYIRYSTSEFPASCSAGALYTSAISVATSRTIYVLACDNAGNSATSSFSYVISISSGGGGGGGGYTHPQPPVLGPIPVKTSVVGNNIIFYFDVKNASQFVISENQNFSGKSWEAYIATKTLTFAQLVPKETKTFYIKFRTATGSESASRIVNVTIPEPPVIPIITPPVVATTSTVITPKPAAKPTQPAVKRYKFSKFLSAGMRGLEIKLLQLRLQELGFLPKTIKANGVYGPATKAAVIKLQKFYKLKPPAGYVGPGTRTILNGK